MIVYVYAASEKLAKTAGYTRERFAELLDVSVSYMAEVERGRTGVSVKMLVKICDVLGLSADYVLFGEQRGEDDLRAQRIGRHRQPLPAAAGRHHHPASGPEQRSLTAAPHTQKETADAVSFCVTAGIQIPDRTC